MKKLQQKVHRESQQDGINEICMGLFFFFYTFVFDNLCKGVKTESPIFIFFVLIAVYPLIYFKLIRNSFIYPRMGYVNIKEEITLGFTLTVILPLIILPIAIYLMVWVLKDFPGIDTIIKWMSPVFGVIFAALYFSYEKRFGERFFYVLMAVSIVAGAVFMQVSLALSGAALVILLNGLILFVYGIYMLIRFMRKYPRQGKQLPEVNEDLGAQENERDCIQETGKDFK